MKRILLSLLCSLGISLLGSEETISAWTGFFAIDVTRPDNVNGVVRVSQFAEEETAVNEFLVDGVHAVGWTQDNPTWDSRSVSDGWHDLTLTQEETTARILVLNKGLDAASHEGTLETDETWAADAVHVVESNLVIPEGRTLAINDDAVVKFNDDAMIILDGGEIEATSALFPVDVTAPVIVSGVVRVSSFAEEETAVPFESEVDGVFISGFTYLTEFIVDGVHAVGWTRDYPMWDSRSVPDGWHDLLLTPENATVRILVLNGGQDIASHGGALEADETWSAGAVHVVDSSIVVSEGHTLTIADDAVVKFNDDAAIIMDGGELKASSALFPIDVTEPENVNGIVRVSHFAEDDTAENEFIVDGVHAVGWTRDNPMWDSRSVPDGWHDLLLTQENATVRILVLNGGLDVASHGGALETDETWSADAIHVVESNLVISSGRTLTIADDAVVKFIDGATILMDGGDIEASSALFPIDVTEPKIASGIVRVSHFAEDDPGVLNESSLDGVFLTYNEFIVDGVHAEGWTRDNPMWDTRSVPDGWHELKLTHENVTARILVMNGNRNALYHAGTLDADEIWTGDDFHVLTSSVMIPEGVTLTIVDNAILKFDDDAKLLLVGGSINYIAYARPLPETLPIDDFRQNQTTLNLTAVDGWSISGMPDWLDLEMNAGSGSARFSALCEYNPVEAERNAVLKVTLNCGLEYLTTVTQIAHPPIYDLTVDDVTTQVNRGVDVNVTAEDRKRYTFSKWTAEGIALAQPTAKTQTFVMPANNVTLTSSYTTEYVHLTYDLMRGWNLIAPTSRLDEESRDLLLVHNPMVLNAENNGLVIATADDAAPGKPLWIHCNDPVALTLYGLPAPQGELSLNTGWNLIGAFKDVSRDLLPTNISSVWEWTPMGFKENTDGFKAGKGYWICVE